MSGTEQRGVCAGGKKPTARSINRILKLFESFKIRTAGRKYFFDTLTPPNREGFRFLFFHQPTLAAMGRGSKASVRRMLAPRPVSLPMMSS